MIEWTWPWLLLLAPLPWLVARIVPTATSQQPALRAPFYQEWRQLSEAQVSHTGRGGLIPVILLWLVWLLLLTAAARPLWIGEAIELPNSGRDLMMAMDISRSMTDESRIEAVKQVGADFIDQRAGDRLGLILFGTYAYVQSPLTFDTATVKRFLLEARAATRRYDGFAGGGTAIADAIGLAVKRLKDQPAESRVLILLTDGEDNASSVTPLDAANVAASLGIRIYTIGIGSKFDEAGLQEIARLTGGKYFRARNQQQLEEIYQLLDQLEPQEQSTATYRPRQSLGYVPLLAALLLSFLLALRHCWHSISWRGAAKRHNPQKEP